MVHMQAACASLLGSLRSCLHQKRLDAIRFDAQEEHVAVLHQLRRKQGKSRQIWEHRRRNTYAWQLHHAASGGCTGSAQQPLRLHLRENTAIIHEARRWTQTYTSSSRAATRQIYGRQIYETCLAIVGGNCDTQLAKYVLSLAAQIGGGHVDERCHGRRCEAFRQSLRHHARPGEADSWTVCHISRAGLQ